MNNNEDYAEVSVKGNNKKITFQNRIKGILLIVGGFFIGYSLLFMIPRELISLSSLVIVLYLFLCLPFGFKFIMPTDIEYDYLCVNSEIEIDSVINQSKRKHIMTFSLENVKRVAPEGRSALLGYEGRNDIKVRDFTSADPSAKRYVLILEKDSKDMKIVLEPSEHMLEMIKRYCKDTFYAE